MCTCTFTRMRPCTHTLSGLSYLQERCHRGEELLRSLERWASLSSAHLQDYEVKVHAFWARLQDFSQRVRTTGHSLDRAVRLYAFLDQVGLVLFLQLLPSWVQI